LTPEARDRTDVIPDHAECLSLLREAGCSDDVVAHCESVAATAVKIAERCGACIPLVEAGALLHDIGRSRSHSIDHAVEGASLARGLGLPDPIVRMIERHIGAGLLKAEAVSLGLPARDFVPETLEEKIVAHADNLTAGRRRVSSDCTVADLARHGLSDAALRVRRLHDELSGIAGMDLDRIV
jgi:uncharacterized protein (TIGR00295 family)